MEKLYSGYYPFSISAEQKTSKAGKQYISIGICHKTKDKDGNKKDVYINLIDKKDLLVMASACENMYHKIIKAENDDFLANKSAEQEPQSQPQETTAEQPTEDIDDIPFEDSRSQ